MDELLFPAEGIGTPEGLGSASADQNCSGPGASVNQTPDFGEVGRNPCNLETDLQQDSPTKLIGRCQLTVDPARKEAEDPRNTSSFVQGGLKAQKIAETESEAFRLATSLGTHYQQIGLAVPITGEENSCTPRGQALLDYWQSCHAAAYGSNIDTFGGRHAEKGTGTAFASASRVSLSEPFSDRIASEPSRPAMTYPIFRIVLTGGPCAGKTTAMALLAERFRSRGFRVFLVPEAATLLFTGGAAQADITRDSERRIQFQSILARFQMTMEDGFCALAKQCGAPAIVLCDRGLLDGRAYMSDLEFGQMLDRHAWNLIEMRDQRYDAVLHLVTAAEGAESYYTCEGHAARSEGLEEARCVDLRTREAWSGHPRLYVIENRNAWLSEQTNERAVSRDTASRTASQPDDAVPQAWDKKLPSPSFSEKMERLFAIVCRLVGLPSPASMLDRKYLLASGEHLLVQLQSDPRVRGLQTFRVEQTFLIRATPQRRVCPSATLDQREVPSVPWASQQEHVRRRGRDGFHSYTHCIRRRYDEPNDHWHHATDQLRGHHESWVELRRNISAQEYNLLLNYADPKHRNLLVWRSCFFFNDGYFVLDRVENANRGPVALLRTSASTLAEMSFSPATQMSHLPLADSILREVTSEPSYTFHALSLGRRSA